ncbi:YhdP family protein [Maricurvus nonylphenolicus]|uniref:YhdP family protein n=1 Tax=Maricurvus nonylphenolicus TaxID=1008307 RepID=UPI0036F3018F
MIDHSRWLAKKLWGLFALLLVLTALLVQLGREFLPMVGEYRQQLAEEFSTNIGLPVSIDEIQGVWEGLAPKLSVNNLVISTESGQEVLRVDSALLQLDVLGTLLDQSLTWRKVYFSGVKAALQQKQDGAWTLTGLSTEPGKAQGTGEEAGGLMEAFNRGRYVEFKDINLKFNFSSGRQRELRLTEMLLENSGDFHRLVADIDLPEQQEAFKVVTEGYGDSSDLDSYLFNGHIQFTNFPLSSSAFFSEALADKPLINNGVVNLSLWLSMDQPREVQLNGQARIDTTDENGQQNHVTAVIKGESDFQTDWLLALNDLSLEWQGENLPALDVQLESRNQGETVSVKAAEIDLAVWYRFVEQQQLLQGKLKSLFDDLNPRGRIENARVDIPLANPAGFELQAQLNNVFVGAWNGAPALTEVSGFVQADSRGGWVDLDSQQGFSMHYPMIYHEPMAYESAKGQVAWHLDKDNNQIAVNSGRLQLVDKQGRADGYFYLDLPWFKDSRPSELTLQIGLQDAPAVVYKKYVPFVVDEATRSWLDSSIKDGAVSQAGFVYRSYISKAFDLGGTIQLLVDVDNGHLQYHPDWPAVKNVSARVIEDDTEVVVSATQATLLEGNSSGLTVALSPNSKGKGSLLNVKGQLQGPAEDGLDLLRKTPLRQVIGDQFDSWHLSGAMSTQVDLDIPLTPGQPGERQDVVVNLDSSKLSMEDLNLQVDKVAGAIHYNTQRGLNSSDLSASLWGENVSVAIASSVSATRGMATEVKFAGNAQPKHLAQWTQRPEVLFAQGKIPYQANLQLPAKGTADYQAKLSVVSDLKGVAIDLPVPYGKVAGDVRKFTVDVPIAKGSTQYGLNYNDQVSALFEQRGNQLIYGEVVLDQPLDEISFNKYAEANAEAKTPTLRVLGQADNIQLLEWQSVLARYNNYIDEIEATSQSSGQGGSQSPTDVGLAQLLDLQISELDISDFRLEDLAVTGERLANGWSFKPVNKVLAGEVIVFDDDTPITLNLDYLTLAEKQADPNQASTEDEAEVTTEVDLSGDPFKDLDPAELIPLNVSVGKVNIGGEDYGAWSFKLRPSQDQLYIKDILGQMRGMLIAGYPVDDNKPDKAGVKIDEQNQGAALRWHTTEKGARTYFSGRIKAQNLGDVMESWGANRALESRNAIFDLDIEWPGSPAAIAVKKLQGSFTVDIDKGSFSKTAGAGSSALLRLMGLFNFDSWARRLQLDFSDTYRSGTAFDHIDGRLTFDDGIIVLTDPMVVKTPSARLSMAGSIDINNEELDTTLVATLPVGGNLTVIAAFAGGLPAAAGVYAISKIFKSQVDKVASVSYGMTGSWADPNIKFNRLFDSKGAERAATTAEDKMATRHAPAEESSSEDTEKVEDSE